MLDGNWSESVSLEESNGISKKSSWKIDEERDY